MSKEFAPEALLIVNDAPRAVRVQKEHKYDQTFAAMRHGQAIKCSRADLASIASAMRRYVVRTGADAHVKTAPDYGDGMGRVWLMGGKK